MRDVLRPLLRNHAALFGLAVIVLMTLAALLAPQLAPYPPGEQFFDGLTLEGAPLPPNERFWLGTDLLGRDLLSRLIFGARTSLIIGIVANGVAVLVGTLLGVVAGYLGGWIGAGIMRFTDLMMAFPALLLAIALAAIFSPSLWIVALVIAMVNWVQVARVVYTQTRALVEKDFIEASRALGAGPLRILARHVLPHLLPTMLVWGTLGIATTVLLEATLSFLGVGVRPPTPSWGNIIFENQTYFATAPWLVFFPGAAILLLALVVQPGRRRAARRARPDPAGTGLGMLIYIAKRLGQAVFILIGITLVTYILLYLVPADPVRQIAGRSATAETVESIRRQLGLDLPLWQQYLRYLGNLLQGDLGRSYIQKTEVTALILSRLPATLQLLAGAIVVELLIGLSAGIFAATRRGRTSDRVVMVLSFAAVSAPQFVVGILLLYVFSVQLGWFPIGGYGTFAHLVLPAVTLGILGGGWYSRMSRSSMIEVLGQDYIQTARAKGAGERRVVFVHAVRNAALPVIAMIGLDIGIFMSGAVVVELVYGWPGIGQLAWQAIQRVDIPIIIGVTLVAAFAIVLGNLLADLAAPFIDPRIKLR